MIADDTGRIVDWPALYSRVHAVSHIYDDRKEMPFDDAKFRARSKWLAQRIKDRGLCPRCGATFSQVVGNGGC